MTIKPFNPATAGAAAQGKPRSKPEVIMPDIVELTGTDARASILLIGGSGTGKTYGIGRLLRAGLNGLIIAAEPKVQGLLKYKPKVIQLSSPVKDANGKVRKPLPNEVYDRLMRFVELLGEGYYREHEGKPLDFIATDGFLEMGQIIYNYWKMRNPTSSSTGERNSYALWENVAERGVDVFKSMRDAAGLACQDFGLPAISAIATIGEHANYDKGGTVTYEPLFPGRKAPELLPYQFEVVLRLSVRKNDEGMSEFIMHTVGENDPYANEKFYAKVPSGLFASEIINPDFAEVYDKIQKSYMTEETTNE